MQDADNFIVCLMTSCTVRLGKSTPILQLSTMASSLEHDEAGLSSVDLQAFDPEPPTYDNAFPALSADSRPDLLQPVSWQPKFITRQSKCTQVRQCLIMYQEIEVIFHR